MITRTNEDLLTVLRVDQFLIREARLLDEWRLDEWASLFTDDARYIVPASDWTHGDPSDSLVMIADDTTRLRARVQRLMSGRAYRESPRSRTRRLVTNVAILGDADGVVRATANFSVHRFRAGEHDEYVGRYIYELTNEESGFRIRLRRAELDDEALRPYATVSIIL